MIYLIAFFFWAPKIQAQRPLEGIRAEKIQREQILMLSYLPAFTSGFPQR
jgi:hypothetical protein